MSFSYRTNARILAASFAMIQVVPAHAALALSDTPLFVASNLPPNLIVTLDDSGSMAGAYVPDAISSASATRRFKSAKFNPLYFNPDITYTAPTNAAGATLTTSFTAALINGFDSTRGSVNLSNGYRPTLSHDPSSTTQSFANHPTGDFASATAGTAAYYYIYQATNGGCNGLVTTEACYTKVLVSAAQQQNFANWYSFYRTRNLATISGASRALATLDPTVRVAWQALNSCASFSGTACSGWTGGNKDNRIRKFDGAHKANFMNWAQRLPASGTTPTRGALVRAGAYFQTSGLSSPYAEDPQISLGSEWGCRKNFTLVMSDGFWNETTTPQISAVGNADATAVTLPDGTAYSGSLAPYADSYSSPGLADVAFYYWSRDLRPTLANNVPPYQIDSSGDPMTRYWNPKNDPATWQHMTTFTVGLGLTSALASIVPPVTWGGDTYSGSYSAFASGTAWPTISNNTAANVADLWHAAINGRGQFFSADDPEQLVDAFQAVVNRVVGSIGTGGSLASNSYSVGAGTNVYQALYNPQDWSGDLRQISLTSTGGLPAPGTNGLMTANWSAAAKLANPDQNARVIVTSLGGVGKPFRWASLGSAQASLLNAGDPAAKGDARVKWLRGDASNEGSAGYQFRARPTTKMGDVVNSSPVRLGTPGDNLDEPGFEAFRLSNCSGSSALCTGSRPAVIFVGANDGMLHAFSESTGDELLAYVPEAVHPKLKELTSPGYAHKFYVDAPPGVFSANVNGWKSFLVGGMGAGGRGVYALDVTNPGSFAESNAGNIVKWEFNASSDSDVGHVFGTPIVTKSPSGDWSVFFGNGYNSGAGKAYLFIKSLKTGAVTKIATNSETDNGLAMPSLIDNDGDGVVDYGYAGDLKGNMWKFDFTTSTPTSSLLYTAKNADNIAQPITIPPELFSHPRGGVFVVFGSGMAMQSADVLLANATTQSLYGIWDVKEPFPGSAGTVPGRPKLKPRTFTEATGGAGQVFRTLTAPAIEWFHPVDRPTGQFGWYVDLPTTNERVLHPPVGYGTRVRFTTTIPSQNPCDVGGTSWTLDFEAITGAPTPYTLFDTNGDGVINSSDLANAAGRRRIGVGGNPLTLRQDGGTQLQLECNNVGAGCGGGSVRSGVNSGRMNWRDIAQ